MVKIVDGRIDPDQLGYYFQAARFANIGSASATVTFPRAYAETPVVVATPARNITWARVSNISERNFDWLADTSGSAHWFAFGQR